MCRRPFERILAAAALSPPRPTMDVHHLHMDAVHAPEHELVTCVSGHNLTDHLDATDYPIRKRRRTKEASRAMRADAHKLCALAIAADIDLFGHLARRADRPTASTELASVTGVEPQLLDSILHTLAADGWLVEMASDHFLANRVTHAMTDPDFQVLVAHCFEMGLPAAMATPRFLNNINFKESQDSAFLAWHVSKATSLGFFDYFNEADT